MNILEFLRKLKIKLRCISKLLMFGKNICQLLINTEENRLIQITNKSFEII